MNTLPVTSTGYDGAEIFNFLEANPGNGMDTTTTSLSTTGLHQVRNAE